MALIEPITVTVEIVDMRPLEWTAVPPTVPGDYLCAYRFKAGYRWNHRRMLLTPAKLPILIDTSETMWYGPIPELKV